MPADLGGKDEDRALQDARRGDVAAFNVLVGTHQSAVYNLCYRTVGNADDAADATQDAFLSAYRAINSFQGTAGSFRSWLLRIAVNACYDSLRRKQRHPSQSLDALVDDEDDGRTAADLVEDREGSPEQQALSAETARCIQDGLDRLSQDHRLAVVLCDVQRYRYEETAEILGIEVGTVKSRLSRARSQLRAYLSEKGELPGGAQRLEVQRP